MSIVDKYKKMFNKFDYIGNYSADWLAHLKKGDAVKVSHLNKTFWVAITCNRGNKFVGKVDNDLFLKHGFDHGDVIKFKAANVLRYESTKEGSWL